MAADDEEVKPLTTATTNYGWVKPDVGGSDDLWGGLLNSDLDGIDSVVHGIQTSIPTVPAASATAPVMDGTASAGSSAAWSRGDHVHPSDTTKYNTSNPSGYQTAAQVTASLSPYALTTSLASYLALSGGTMTGAMTLAADPAANLQPATKQYVDAVRVGDNRIINGDMRIDQRNNGASGTASAYTVDRWSYVGAQASKGTWGRVANTAHPEIGFGYCLGFNSSSAYAAVAADYFQLNQAIEADAVSDFAWGTAGAQPATLSFWAQSTLTGTFGGSINNYAVTRSYPFSYSIPVANTWTKIAITIPGDTGGAWVMTGNGGSVYVIFDLGCGSNRRGPPNAWASANYNSVPGAVSIVGTNGAGFLVTGVKLEIGSVATPYNRQSLAKSMADCQRYYQQLVGGNLAVGWQGNAGGSVFTPMTFLVSMRAAPTVVYSGQSYTNASGLTTNGITSSNIVNICVATAIGIASAIGTASLSAEL